MIYRHNNEPDPMPEALSQIANGAPGAPAHSLAQAVDNDKWLADSVNELRDKSQEYARLNTEQARREWEQVTRANIVRKRDQAEQREARTAADQARTQAKDDLDDTRLLQHFNELAVTLPRDGTATEWNLPLDQLRDVAQTQQALDIAARRRGLPGIDEQSAQQPAQPHPETFPDGSVYQLTNLPDGNLEVKLITGEVFKGDPATVMGNIAVAQVNTKRWGQSQRSQQQPAIQQQAPPQLNQEAIQQASSIADYWADEQAKALGFSNRQEMIQWGQDLTQFREEYRDNQIASDFLLRCPDFPNSEEASEKLTAIINANGWQTTPDSLQAAHALAVQRHLYQPLSAEEQQASIGIAPQSTRSTPPPMIRSQSPESSFRHEDVHSMPLEQLRKLAIQQELEGKGSALHR